MDLRKMMVVCAVALGGFAVGCKSDCESVCSDEKDCAGADKSTDCSKECDDADKAADKFGCKSQLDDLWSCASGVDDICNAASASKCSSQTTAMLACEQKYCTAHPDDADCNSDSLP